MPRPLLRRDAFAACRQIWVWLLALSMAFQSVSAAIIGVTGVQHRHVACAALTEEPEPTGADGFFQAFLHSVLGEGVMAIVAARQHLAHAASPHAPATAFPVVWTGPIPDDLVIGEAVTPSRGQTVATNPDDASQVSAGCHRHPAHTHSGYERHMHAHGDVSTVNIGQADGGDDASLMHAELPPALEATPLSIQVTVIAADRQAWPVHQQAQPRSWRPAPQERPPRA